MPQGKPLETAGRKAKGVSVCAMQPRQPAAKGEKPAELEVCLWKEKIHSRIGFIPLSLREFIEEYSQAFFLPFFVTRTNSIQATLAITAPRARDFHPTPLLTGRLFAL